MKHLANLDWEEDGTPYSNEFEDFYFSKGQGPEEVEHVFLSPNKIRENFQIGKNLCIAELGFGTGLNFLMTMKLFDECLSKSKFSFYSVEKFPLKFEEFKQVYETWPKLKNWSDKLLPHLQLKEGWNKIEFRSIEFNIFIGDVVCYLESLLEDELKFDVWFLDGFAPGKNFEMWNTIVLRKVGELSKYGATLSTYTAVGQVRRDLISAGFEMTKLQGFGKKR